METKKLNLKNEGECQNFIDKFAYKALDYFDEDLSLWEKKKPIDGVKIYRKKSKEGKSLKREEGILNIEIKEFIKEILGNPDFAKNEIIKESIKDKIHDGKFFHHWSISKSYPLFSAREIEFFVSEVDQPDGSILLAGASIETQDMQKDSIRADCAIIAWLLKEDDKDKNKTIAQNVSNFDLKGNIPQFINDLIDSSLIADTNNYIKNKK